jgi:acylphosphatase
MVREAGGARIRRRVIYHGRVQGVFFRATSREIARRFAVTGYVRNLRDGTVELEAEGTREQVEAFLSAVADHFRGNIERAEISEITPVGSEGSFEVRY